MAAPTAGLHFTPDLVERLGARGVGMARVTLHVGYGTFQPIEAEQIEDHRMHSEEYEVDEDTCRAEVHAFLDDLVEQGLVDVGDPRSAS